MKIIDCVQGTDEWMKHRVGVPSASRFSEIITNGGDPSKSRTKYMYQLAGETLCGEKEPTYQSRAMLNGIEREEEAREFYEFLYDVEVQQVGFCLSDDGYGCSPDGLIGEDEGQEIKCPNLATHVEYLVKGTLPLVYRQQVQGSMLVTGRKVWTFMSYYPNVKPLILKVERNEDFIDDMKFELEKFCKELNELVIKLK